MEAAEAALSRKTRRKASKLEGFETGEIPDILDAIGDDARDRCTDSPQRHQYDRLWSTPEHGSFPRRND